MHDQTGLVIGVLKKETERLCYVRQDIQSMGSMGHTEQNKDREKMETIFLLQ